MSINKITFEIDLDLINLDDKKLESKFNVLTILNSLTFDELNNIINLKDRKYYLKEIKFPELNRSEINHSEYIVKISA